MLKCKLESGNYDHAHGTHASGETDLRETTECQPSAGGRASIQLLSRLDSRACLLTESVSLKLLVPVTSDSCSLSFAACSRHDSMSIWHNAALTASCGTLGKVHDTAQKIVCMTWFCSKASAGQKTACQLLKGQTVSPADFSLQCFERLMKPMSMLQHILLVMEKAGNRALPDCPCPEHQPHHLPEAVQPRL